MIVDELESKKTPDKVRSRMARKVTDRHFQVGADGLMFLEGADGCDCSMRLFEPAGNEADMCGNGIRCIAAYMMDKLGTDEVDVLTRDGPKHIVLVRGQFKVDMGLVRTNGSDLKGYISDKGKSGDSMLSMKLKVGSKTYNGSIVNSGEPHIVVRTNDLASLDMKHIGDTANADHKRFPKGVNLNFVQVTGPQSIKIRTYERGVYGETMACGTGATASAAVALILGWVRPGQVNVQTRGGRLVIELDDTGRASMTGPATRVYEGTISVEV